MQQKDNNENNDKNTQSCNITILDNIKWLNSFSNVCIINFIDNAC